MIGKRSQWQALIPTAHDREEAVQAFLAAFDERENLIVRVKAVDTLAYMAADERLTTARAALVRYLSTDTGEGLREHDDGDECLGLDCGDPAHFGVGGLCPACHHRDHDPGSCPDCPRCELHFDEAMDWLRRHGALSTGAPGLDQPGCHQHGGWHHHGGFEHSGEVAATWDHPDADHAHAARLASPGEP